MNRNETNAETHSKFWRAAVVLMAMSAAVGCKRDETKTTVDEVVDETARFYGQEVTVTGEVAEREGDRAFVLEAGGLAQDQVLVLTKSPIQLTGDAVLEQGDNVRVTGVVHNFDVTAIEREVGWDLEPQMEAEYVNEPVIVARSFGLLREQGVWREGTGYVGATDTGGTGGDMGGGGTGGDAMPPNDAQELRGGIEQITLIVAAVRPLDMVGRRVIMENVPVRKVAGDRSVWVGERGDQQILVHVEGDGQDQEARQMPKLKAGQKVNIRGSLQRMPAANQVIEDWGVSAAMRNAIEGQALYLRAEQVELVQPS